MASCGVIAGSLCSVSPSSPKLHNKQILTLYKSHFLSSSCFNHKQYPLPSLHLQKPRTRNAPSSGPVVFAVQSNFAKIIQTAWTVGKYGVEAGTNLVPVSDMSFFFGLGMVLLWDSVPRPMARIGVTVALLVVAQFVLRSFLSTASVVVGTMGLVYFIFLALNKDQGQRGGGGQKFSDDSLEEARRIMEKYK